MLYNIVINIAIISTNTMVFYTSVFIFTFIACVRSEIALPFSPCGIDEIKCLGNAKENFISKTAEHGIEELNIKPIDPLTIMSLEVHDKNADLKIRFSNTNVTGLKGIKITGYKLDKDNKLVQAQMTSLLTIVSDVEVVMIKEQRTFNGHFSATARIIESVEYSYSVVDVNGIEYLEFGPETSTCDPVGEPEVTLTVKLENDADIEIFAKRPKVDKAALRKSAVCEVMTSATAAIMGNWRAAAKAFPRSFFIKDDDDTSGE